MWLIYWDCPAWGYLEKRIKLATWLYTGYQRDLSEWNSAFVQQVHGCLTLVVTFSEDGRIKCITGSKSPEANSITDVIFPWVGPQVKKKKIEPENLQAKFEQDNHIPVR